MTPSGCGSEKNQNHHRIEKVGSHAMPGRVNSIGSITTDWQRRHRQASNDTQTTTLVIGQLCAHAFSSRTMPDFQGYKGAAELFQIWPTGPAIEWWLPWHSRRKCSLALGGIRKRLHVRV